MSCTGMSERLRRNVAARLCCCSGSSITPLQLALFVQLKTNSVDKIMRDISNILQLWAGWARSEISGVDYSPIAAGFKGLIPQTSRSVETCSDDDGLLIDSCIAKLKKRRPDEYKILLSHYYYGVSKRKIAKINKCDEKLIRVKMLLGEGFIDGCLSMMNITLDCE